MATLKGTPTVKKAPAKKAIAPKKKTVKKKTGCDGVVFVKKNYDYWPLITKTMANLPSLKTLKAMNTKNKGRAGVEMTFSRPITSDYERDIHVVWLYGEGFSSGDSGKIRRMSPIEYVIFECIYGHAYYSVHEGETYGYITNMEMFSEEIIDLIRNKYKSKLR